MILREISIFWSLSFMIILLFIFFESRYSRRTTANATVATMLPLILANCAIALFVDADHLGSVMMVTLTVPMATFFFVMSRYRGSKFFFVFFSLDTIVLEIFYLTQVINHYTTPDTNLVMFVLRLVIYPLITWLLYHKLREQYFEVRRSVTVGWHNYALIAILFHLSFTLLLTVPTPITERPEYYPVTLLLFILMPFVYINIITTLRHQKALRDAAGSESALQAQVSMMQSRMGEYSVAGDKFSKERHDFRHKLQTISRMVEMKKYDELLTIIAKYNEALDQTKVKKYCENAVLDAVLSSYLYKAEQRGIQVTAAIGFAEQLPVSDIELATALANAIENAIHACEKLDGERHIEIKAISTPQFMLEVSNTFDGEVRFDEEGIPVNEAEGHGIGARSIVAFCDKYDAFYEFKVQGDRFILRMML